MRACIVCIACMTQCTRAFAGARAGAARHKRARRGAKGREWRMENADNAFFDSFHIHNCVRKLTEYILVHMIQKAYATLHDIIEWRETRDD